MFEERQRQDQLQQQDLLKKQQHAQTQRQIIIQQQQQYQNHQVFNKVATNGHTNVESGFPLEVLCKIHDKDYQELTKLAECLRSDLSKLTEELGEIRKDTPEYSVSELKI